MSHAVHDDTKVEPDDPPLGEGARSLCRLAGVFPREPWRSPDRQGDRRPRGGAQVTRPEPLRRGNLQGSLKGRERLQPRRRTSSCEETPQGSTGKALLPDEVRSTEEAQRLRRTASQER